MRALLATLRYLNERNPRCVVPTHRSRWSCTCINPCPGGAS